MSGILSVIAALPDFEEWFAMMPGRILLNKNLNGTDRDVYCSVAICVRARAGSIELVQRDVAQFLGCSQETVKRSLRKLIEARKLMVERKVGGASVYTIAAKPKDGLRKPVQSATVAKKGVTCSKCNRQRPMILKAGICRSCNWDLKVRRIAQEEIEKTG